jgi:hypothetical protein
MKLSFLKLFTTISLVIFNISICKSQDYLVTKSDDTIFGKIEWKTNVFVFVENENGKQKFRADKVKFFQRGDFRFVSVKTKFPEFLLEVINGELSYYLESHLKSRYTLNYERKVYLKYKEKLYPITVSGNEDNNNFNQNPNSSINSPVSFEIHSSNFEWSFYQILGKNHILYKLIKNNNYSIDDIEQLVDLSNKSFTDFKKFNKLIDTTINKGFATGYVIKVENDTIHGSIKMNGRFILSEQLNLIDKQGFEFSYNPKELIAYKINDNEYLNDLIEKKEVLLNQVIKGKISLYRDLKNSKSYLKKEGLEYVLVDNDKEFLEVFKDRQTIYDRIIENNYEPFEIKSIVRLYNNAP